MKTILLLCSLIPSDGTVAVVTELPSTPRPLPSTPRPAAITDDYAAAYAEAVRGGRPLIVWVGQRPRILDGCVSVYQPTFKFSDGAVVKTGVIVSMPKGTWMEWVATLDGTPTDAMIHESLHPSGARTQGASPATEEGPARVFSGSSSVLQSGSSAAARDRAISSNQVEHAPMRGGVDGSNPSFRNSLPPQAPPVIRNRAVGGRSC